MSLGKRLKQERERRNWTQKYAAEQSGISHTVLSNYERDFRDPDTDTLKRLAELYDVKVDYLLGRNLDENIQPFIDPELNTFFKELLESSPGKREKLLKIWDIIK